MPSNLHALIRYKTIDSCLRNKFSPCTILQLQRACSEALEEAYGKGRLISERTIRDDIRVMRSELLGFEAPIECENGVYFYADPGYSIFHASIMELRVVEKLVKLLLENARHLDQEKLALLLLEISGFKNLPGSVRQIIEQYILQQPTFDDRAEEPCFGMDIMETQPEMSWGTGKPGKSSTLLVLSQESGADAFMIKGHSRGMEKAIVMITWKAILDLLPIK